MAHIGKAHSAYTKISPSTHKSENLKWINNAVNQTIRATGNPRWLLGFWLPDKLHFYLMG